MHSDRTRIKDWKLLYWGIIFSLLFVPVLNSLCVNLKLLIGSSIASSEYKLMLSKLQVDNKRLVDKVKVYKTEEGLKTYVKESLNKVEEGELLIKYNDKN